MRVINKTPLFTAAKKLVISKERTLSTIMGSWGASIRHVPQELYDGSGYKGKGNEAVNFCTCHILFNIHHVLNLRAF